MFEHVDMRQKSIVRSSKRLRINLNKITNDLLRKNENDIVLKWLNYAGLTYSGIPLEQNDDLHDEAVLLEKNIYGADGSVEGHTTMLLSEDESAGTKKFYAYIGWIYQKFREGGMFISDEIDNNFHPSLLQRLVSFFNDSDINSANAQLLFTSHETTLMSPDILRRDQIYFTEKSSRDESILYSLSDLKGIRNNADFARQYLAGFYGALPLLETYRSESSNSFVKSINQGY